MNSKIGISIIVCNYKGSLEDILFTLKSSIHQKGIEYEVLFCDDGSDNCHINEIFDFIKANNVKNCRLLLNDKNVGTVKNILNGVKEATYDFVKPIGVGDSFYSETTCRDVVNFMRTNSLDISFSDAVYFTNDASNTNVHNFAQPAVRDIYNLETLDREKIIKNLLLYRDFFLGATLFYKKDRFEQYLKKFENKIIYEEDIINIASIIEGAKIARFPHYGVFYEFSGGITNNRSSFIDKLNKDTKTLFGYVKDHTDIPYRVKAYELCDFYTSKIKKVVKSPSSLFFKLKAKKAINEKKDEVSFAFFENCRG